MIFDEEDNAIDIVMRVGSLRTSESKEGNDYSVFVYCKDRVEGLDLTTEVSTYPPNTYRGLPLQAVEELTNRFFEPILRGRFESPKRQDSFGFGPGQDSELRATLRAYLSPSLLDLFQHPSPSPSAE